MKKAKIIAVLLCICLAVCLTACGNDTAGGLGKLVIGHDDDNTPTSPGKTTKPTSGIPDLGGNGGSTPTPTPKDSRVPTIGAPTPTPTPVTAATPTPVPSSVLETTYYTNQYVSMRIPKGWEVNCQAYDSGGGKFRLMCVVYDPADYANQIFFCTALEPLFPTESDKAMFLLAAPEYTFAPVISEHTSAAVLKEWHGLYVGINQTDVTRPKISTYIQDWQLKTVISTEDGGIVNGGYHTAVTGACTLPNGSEYTVYLETLLVPVNSFGMNCYISYGNFLASAKASVSAQYLPVLGECLRSVDTTAFQRSVGAGIATGDDIDMDSIYSFDPKTMIDYDALDSYLKNLK